MTAVAEICLSSRGRRDLLRLNTDLSATMANGRGRENLPYTNWVAHWQMTVVAENCPDPTQIWG